MRIANLSAGGDPFIASLVLTLWKKYWYTEIDRMIVNYNNHAEVPQEVVEEFLSRVSRDPKVDIIYHPTGVGNGTPIKEGTLLAPEESYILLLEDDQFIFTPGIVDHYFEQLEVHGYDVVGSARYTHGEVAEAAQKKYDLDYSGEGDRGFGFWPTMFFTKQEHLLKTDLDFGSKKYPKGEYFRELDHTMQEDDYTDTFTWASLQLRHQGLHIMEIPHFHADPYEIESKLASQRNWKNGQKPPYMHGGSLSSGWGGYLSGAEPDTSTDIAKQEIETRVAWWKIALETTDGFSSFREDYRKGIDDLVERGELSSYRIGRKEAIYKELLGL